MPADSPRELPMPPYRFQDGAGPSVSGGHALQPLADSRDMVLVPRRTAETAARAIRALYPSSKVAGELEASLSASPARGEGDAPSRWSAVRNLFVRHAEAFNKATRYEEASAIADEAGREIEELFAPSTTSTAGEDFFAPFEAYRAPSPGEGDAPVAWRANVLNTIVGTDAWELSHEEPKPRRGYRIREVQRLGVLPDQTFPAEREVGRAIYERIERLTADGAATPELAHLSELVESVEEVGGYDGPSRPTPATPAGLREALGRSVVFNAYSADDPLALRFEFETEEDRLAAANAVDAALQPQAQGGE